MINTAQNNARGETVAVFDGEGYLWTLQLDGHFHCNQRDGEYLEIKDGKMTHHEEHGNDN